MMSVLKVYKLTKSYRTHSWAKPKTVLHNISFEVASGGMTGFLGINGSGKSTTIKCLLNLIAPDSGDISFFGLQFRDDIKKRVAYLPEKPQLYDHLTGEEFLNFTLRLSGKYSSNEISKRVDEYLEKVQLMDSRKYKIREYSKGMYQRIGLAQAISRDADFIILDEPMSDLDPAGRHLVKTILRQIQAEKKVSILMSSHLLQDIEDLCQSIVILNKGYTKYSGPTIDFMKSIKPTYEIQYYKNGQVISVQVDKNLLQSKIDELRKQSLEIVGVYNQNNLEEAFQKFIGVTL
jgi:ABC-2 type transport system ATP-binding protein